MSRWLGLVLVLILGCTGSDDPPPDAGTRVQDAAADANPSRDAGIRDARDPSDATLPDAPASDAASVADASAPADASGVDASEATGDASHVDAARDAVIASDAATEVADAGDVVDAASADADAADTGVHSNGHGACIDGGDCDDGIDCTYDACEDAWCVHRLSRSLCAPGEVCDLRRGGCALSSVCGSYADCQDADPCTRFEACDLATSRCYWNLLDNDVDYHASAACGGDDFNDADVTLYAGAIERCDGKDNDGDGTVDQNAQANAMCRGLPNVVAATCVGGTCDIDECVAPFGDCDGNPLNGCETDTTTSNEHCGACGYSCGYCVDGQCPAPACTSYRDTAALRDGDYGYQVLIRDIVATECVTQCGLADQACLAACAVHRSNGDLTDGCAACLAIEPACTAACEPCADEASCDACVCQSQCYQNALACSGVPMLFCPD